MSFLAAALFVVAPVSLGSCGSDDETTQIINQIVNMLLGSSDELYGTKWLSADGTKLYEFGANNSALESTLQNNIIVAQREFTYAISGENNSTLTFTFADGTEAYTITEYTKQQSITLQNQSTGTSMAFKITTQTFDWADDLSNTSWQTSDNSRIYSFGYSSKGTLRNYDSNVNLVGTESFTYTLTSDESNYTVLTLTFSGRTETYHIMSYAEGSSMVLKSVAGDETQQLRYYEEPVVE